MGGDDITKLALDAVLMAISLESGSSRTRALEIRAINLGLLPGNSLHDVPASFQLAFGLCVTMDDDPPVEICQNCGGYYWVDTRHAKVAKEQAFEGQRCIPCMGSGG